MRRYQIVVLCVLMLSIICLSAGVSIASISDDIERAQQLLDAKDYDGAMQIAKQIASGSSDLADLYPISWSIC